MRASQIVDGKKQCRICKQWLPVDQFYKNSRAATGLDSACKGCLLLVQRARVITPEKNAEYQRRYKKRFPEKVALSKRRRHIWDMYRVTLEWYDMMLELQGGVCAICGEPETVMRFGKLKILAVDHDHSTGTPRGLLCQGCNQGIGHFGEDVALMESAVDYLDKHQAP